MATPPCLSRWFRLPGRLALILGLGALSTAGAQGATAEGDGRAGAGGGLIRSEDGKIYLSEGGRETELQFTATPERDHLLRLLEEHGPAGVKLDADPRLIMSGGGGAGFSFWDLRKHLTDKPAPQPEPATAPPNSKEQRPARGDQGSAAAKKG